jgi:hypothetical protein
MIDFTSKIKDLVKAKKQEAKRINESILFILNSRVNSTVFKRGSLLSNHYYWQELRTSVDHCLLLIPCLSNPLSKFLKENEILNKMKDCSAMLKQISVLTKVNKDKGGREVDKEKVRVLITDIHKLYSVEIYPNVNKLVRASLKQSLNKASKIKI